MRLHMSFFFLVEDNDPFTQFSEYQTCWCWRRQGLSSHDTGLVLLKCFGFSTSDMWLVRVWYVRAIYIDGLAQYCSNSSALAMELLQSCAKPSICPWTHLFGRLVAMATSYYIGVDVGTSGVRAALVSAGGDIISTASQIIQVLEPQPDFFEQSSDDIWAACCKVVKVGHQGQNTQTTFMSVMSQVIGNSIVCSTACSGYQQREPPKRWPWYRQYNGLNKVTSHEPSVMTSQISVNMNVCSTACSGYQQRNTIY